MEGLENRHATKGAANREQTSCNMTVLTVGDDGSIAKYTVAEILAIRAQPSCNVTDCHAQGWAEKDNAV